MTFSARFCSLMTIEIKIQQLDHGKSLEIPTYATSGSSGVDLRAAVQEVLTIRPGEFSLVPTGISVQIPTGYEAQVRPRSGLAIKHGVTLLNAPGTIDSDYRGEIGVVLINCGKEPFVVRRGDRIAQMVFAKVEQVRLVEAQELNRTTRGHGGFGHTGK